VRKTLVALLLGASLIAPCRSVLAETPRPSEARWGIRPEKRSPTLLDFARWLSERFRPAALEYEVEPLPEPAPVSSPDPGPAPATCPERIHCPIG